MRVLVPEIATHVMEGGEGKNQAVLSVDVHPSLPLLVSAGAGENRVIFWTIRTDAEDQHEWLSFACELTSTTFESTVNIVRFSPCGTYLACGDSNGMITLLSVREEGRTWLDAKEERVLRRVHLRGHTMDVQDFAWSPDSIHAASAGMDNLIIVWDAVACTEVQRLKEHTHYAQGVAWSPDGSYLASSSFDETVRINNVSIKKKTVTIQESTVLKKPRLFADEFKGPTFCRRLAFSPERWSGLLVVPGGLTRDGPEPLEASKSGSEVPDAQILDKIGGESVESKRPLTYAAHVFRFSSSGLADNMPVATLTGHSSPSLVVRFHPRAFETVSDNGEGVEPYLDITSSTESKGRFVFAVASTSAIYLYDTQHPQPIAVTDKLHYASYTDAAWYASESGSAMLIVSTRDGCFRMLKFASGELGSIMPVSRPVVELQVAHSEARELTKANVQSELAMESAYLHQEQPIILQDGSSAPNNPAEHAIVGDISSPIILDENSSNSQSPKKQRLTSDVNSSVSGISSASKPDAPSAKITILQPRRVKLDQVRT